MANTHSTKRPATATDFARWTEKARGMSLAALHYSIQDCSEAAKAMQGHDPVAEGVYLDEMNTYIQELNNRRIGARE